MRWVWETHFRANRSNGGVPLQRITGDTIKISNYLEFGFYDRAALVLQQCWVGQTKAKKMARGFGEHWEHHDLVHSAGEWTGCGTINSMEPYKS
jgi:hypothetical protein